MEIHNLMEDAVKRAVHELCDEDERGEARRYCTSKECRLDAICYVLNRIAPHYVTSGRGLAHMASEIEEDSQLRIDIMRLVKEGLDRVTSVQRSFYSDSGQTTSLPGEGPCFNFPAIKGRLFNGKSFEPVEDVDIYLYMDGTLAEMFDSRWQNPYRIVSNTPGTFLFWPAPVTAPEAGVRHTFQGELRIEDERFEEFRHFFTLEVESDQRFSGTFYYSRDFIIQDLYIFAARSVG